MWTQFWDMHSGGGQKEKWAIIYIEAPEEEAKLIFFNRFGHNPDRVSCSCCGNDYVIRSHESLAELTGYHRNCRCLAKAYKGRNYLEEGEAVPPGCELSMFSVRRSDQKSVSLEDYSNQKDVLVIYANDIKPEERKGELHEQGYVWKD